MKRSTYKGSKTVTNKRPGAEKLDEHRGCHHTGDVPDPPPIENHVAEQVHLIVTNKPSTSLIEGHYKMF
jgi:hypothetical protein